MSKILQNKKWRYCNLCLQVMISLHKEVITKLKLLLFILFPWKRLGKIRLDPNSPEINPFVYSSLSEFLIKEQFFKLLAQFSLKMLAFFNQLLFLLSLAQILGEDIHVFPSAAASYYGLIVSVVLRYLLAQLLLWVDFSLRHFYVMCLNGTFEKTIWAEEDTSNRIFGRDVLVTIQTISIIIDGAFIFCAFICSNFFIYWICGIDALIGLLSLTIFIPLSLLISRKRSLLAKQIYTVVQDKLDKVSYWLNWHLYLESWGFSHSFLSSTRDVMIKENVLRNQDSLWRACDLYSICFGKLIPVLIVISLSLLTYPISSGLLTTLWLAIPVVGIIITYNRYQKQKIEGLAAFNEIKKHLHLSLERDCNRIVSKDSWGIWQGSLAENSCEFNHSFDVLGRLNLREELTSDPSSLFLELDGKNLSSGQKSRVLLARGVNLALHYNLPLHVKQSFNNLDPTNRFRIHKCLNDLSAIVLIHMETEIDFDSPDERTSKEALNAERVLNIEEKTFISRSLNSDNQKTPSLLNDILKLCRSYFLIMFLPAIGLNTLASITVLNVPDSWRLISLLLLGLLVFTVVLLMGKAIEAHVREWALEKGYNVLKHPLNWTKADFFQRISENYRTVCERISWYTHDVVWITSLLLFALLSSLYVIGLVALIVSVFFIILSLYIWRMLNPAIVFTRQTTVSSLNIYLTKIANLVAISRSPKVEVLNTKRKKESYEAWNALFVSQMESDATKYALSTLLYLLSGILIVTITNLFFYIPHYEALFTLVISAFLYVDYNIAMFFQALSGFNAQRIAMHRLDETEQSRNSFGSLFVKQDSNYSTLACYNRTINQKYPAYVFQSGQSYSVVGNSGSGKTLYLRSLAGMHPCQELVDNKLPREGVIYIDKECIQILGNIERDSSEAKESKEVLFCFLEKKLLEQRRIFIFDEALAHYPLEEALPLSKALAARIESFKGVFLLVDHRFHLTNLITIAAGKSY